MLSAHVSMMRMTIWNWPDAGENAWFYGGNGFPLGFYEPLMRRLSGRFHLRGLHNRACWPDIGTPSRGDGWARYGSDLAQAIGTGSVVGPVVGIGHSMGACSMVLAARAQPDLFKALVLIEPAIVSPGKIRVAKALPRWAGRFVKAVRVTQERCDRWASVDEYLAEMGAHPSFKRFDAEAWAAVATHGVVPAGDGVTLAFPKTWEAYNFFHAEAVLTDIEALEVPVAVIRGRPSYFFPDPQWHELRRVRPDVVTLEAPAYGHLLPIEAPGAAFDLVEQALARLGA